MEPMPAWAITRLADSTRFRNSPGSMKLFSADMLVAIIRRPNLGEDVRFSARTRPFVDGPDQPIKMSLVPTVTKIIALILRSGGLRVAPNAATASARGLRSGPTHDPDIESCSTLAMLSSQTVRAPKSRPRPERDVSGAAPVETTISGLSFHTIEPSRPAVFINSILLQRLASLTT